MPDKREKHRVVSAGAVIYRHTQQGPEFLLVQSAKSSPAWGFPKGHVEKGEELLDTAHREVREEAGVKLNTILQKLPVCRTKDKDVHLYLANTWDVVDPPVPEDPDGEILHARWFPAAEVGCLIHRYQRNVFKVAHTIVTGFYNPLAVDGDYHKK
jgi:8-oxo-dGTP pyrophosphatase MutT (NUDIX family)